MMHLIQFKNCVRLFALLLALASQDSASWPFGAWHRASETPIITPQGEGWEAAGTFNPSVIVRNGKIVMLYRAQDKGGTSRLGYAESEDGLHFTRSSEPVFVPEKDYEKDGGVEDPRLVQFGDTYYLTYTGYNKKDAQLCLATSKDLIHWERKGVIMPADKGNWNVKWTKSGAIVPEKIDGKYWMYFLGTSADHRDQAGPLRFAGRRAGPAAHRHARRNRSDLQRRGRQAGISHRDRDLRPQRSAEVALAK